MPNFPEEYPTPQEFLDAVEKNGWKQARGHLFSRPNGETLAACAAGQALLNLGIVKEDEIPADIFSLSNFNEFLHGWLRRSNLADLYNDVWNMNDRDYMTCKAIANELRKSYVR